ncbi:hypothetical protein PP175_21460 [Aneurinibacillus sp. Ricciae_BoGa-3]|uniref:hypothetical protein n=1 Tax=Aneurinibacillus sp. Ricciae_BoGa-3 TaxID=3022697 RepID=UPI002340279B|nr:hypothetical protein [Aneurinibacillus sp. Ricciae_BoGa-3]WCK53860.1 hypothetical protein PP175_21460 [Aneurinibacillus sp. Ricciae_BoGa-3]
MNKNLMRDANAKLQLQVIELKQQRTEIQRKLNDANGMIEKLTMENKGLLATIRDTARREIQLGRQIDLLQEEIRKLAGASNEQGSLMEAYRKVLGAEMTRQPQPVPVHILWTKHGGVNH